MKFIVNILVISILFLGVADASAKSTVEQMMAKNGVQASHVSILIKNLNSGETLVSINPSTSRKPASVMKLFTTYSALLELGPSFKWPTKIYYNGVYVKGAIEGDLIVKPYGDPTFSSKDIPKIAKRLHSLGIKSISGDVIVDRGFFDANGKINSGFDKNKFSEYNAMPDALMMDDHLSGIEVIPSNGRIVVRKTVPDSSYKIINNLKPSSKACRGNTSWPRVSVSKKESRTVVTLSGPLSLKCKKRVIKKVLSHPYYGMFNLFKSELDKNGIEFGGEMKLTNRPATSRLLFTHYAKKDLLKIVSKTCKKSNNLYARHLLLIQGAKGYGAPATVEKGRKAVMSTLVSEGGLTSASAVYLDNGSGLSRESRVNANALSEILHSAYGKYGVKWRNALSIAGVDGTIKRRFSRSPAKNRAWMKTGTLKDAKNIAGYVKAKTSGTMYSVVILYNGAQKWKGSTLQNKIINWLAK